MLGKNEPGLYYLSNSKLAHCDGEWTRILSRGDYGNSEVRFATAFAIKSLEALSRFSLQTYFSDQTKDSYIQGFGDATKEFFIGLEWLYRYAT